MGLIIHPQDTGRFFNLVLLIFFLSPRKLIILEAVLHIGCTMVLKIPRCSSILSVKFSPLILTGTL